MPQTRNIDRFMTLDVTGPHQMALGLDEHGQVVLLFGTTPGAKADSLCWRSGQVLGPAQNAHHMLYEQSATIMAQNPPDDGLEGITVSFTVNGVGEAEISLPGLSLCLRDLLGETLH